MKTMTLEKLESKKVSIRDLCDRLTSLDSLKGEKHISLFLVDKMENLYKSTTISVVFGYLNIYWGYLNFHLLDHLISQFSLETLQKQMVNYKEDLNTFMDSTSLVVFGKAQEIGDQVIPDGFKELVSHHQFTESTTLKEVEKVRIALKKEYSLEDCALMLYNVLCGSIVIVWLVPESVAEHICLMASCTEKGRFRSNMLTKLQLHGTPLYEDDFISATSLVSITLHGCLYVYIFIMITHTVGISTTPLWEILAITVIKFYGRRVCFIMIKYFLLNQVSTQDG